MLMQAPSNLQSLHLLRALLREASYLPDANARQYFRRHIVNRFRAYQPAQNASSSVHAKALEKHPHRPVKRRDVFIIDWRTRAMQRKGHKGLNYLRRANNGEYPCLRKILFFTYGRVGKRKYALLEELLRPDDPTALEEPSPLQKLYHSNERCLSFFDAPKKASPTHYSIHISDHYARLRTAIKAQHHKGIELCGDIKRPYLLTPINNVWERSMPIKRARGNVRRWYAETMTRFLPPLPPKEFDELQAMAEGTKPISLAKRRSPAIELHPAEEASEIEQFTKRVQDALVLAKPSKADSRCRTRPLTNHFMKRLYATILTFCSKVVWNEKFNKWECVWGDRMRGMNSALNSDAVYDDLFTGVDAKGQMLAKEQFELGQSSLEKEEAEDVKRFLNSSLAEYQKPKTKREKYTVVPFYVDFLPLEHPVRIAADKIQVRKNRDQSASASAPPQTAVKSKRPRKTT